MIKNSSVLFSLMGDFFVIDCNCLQKWIVGYWLIQRSHVYLIIPGTSIDCATGSTTQMSISSYSLLKNAIQCSKIPICDYYYIQVRLLSLIHLLIFGIVLHHRIDIETAYIMLDEPNIKIRILLNKRIDSLNTEDFVNNIT